MDGQLCSILLNSMHQERCHTRGGLCQVQARSCGRVYEAALSCEEYYASTFDSTKKKPSFPKLMSAFIASEGIDRATIEELEKILKNEKSALED